VSSRKKSRRNDGPAWQCGACGEWNATTVDGSVGRRQSYVEDCQVCCRPSVLTLQWDPESGEYAVGSELE